jgi:hypothetical protein
MGIDPNQAAWFIAQALPQLIDTTPMVSGPAPATEGPVLGFQNRAQGRRLTPP